MTQDELARPSPTRVHVGGVETEDDPKQEPGRVTRTNRPAGEDVDPTKEITLYIASNDVELPDLTNQTVGQAKIATEKLGLKVRVAKRWTRPIRAR
jgi:beta-lactam-binding protein with PASTA domain